MPDGEPRRSGKSFRPAEHYAAGGAKMIAAIERLDDELNTIKLVLDAHRAALVTAGWMTADGKVSGMPTDEWLYSEQAAEICGITPAAWRRAALSTPARLATARVRPEEYRRHPQDGRPQWLRRCVERYRDRPERDTVREARETHRAILAAGAVCGGDRAAMAIRLGLHPRIIDRHLDGICACNLPTVSA